MKLAFKLILLFVVAVVGVTAISSHLTSRQFFQLLEKQHQAIAESILNENREELLNAIQSGNLSRLESIMAAPRTRLAQIRWVWFERSVAAPYQPMIGSDYEKIAANSQITSVTRWMDDGKRHLLTYCPMQLDGRRGGIEVTSSLEEIEQQSRRAWINGLLSIGAMGLLSIGVVMIAGVRWVAQPLDALTDKVRRVGHGDLASDLEIKTNDELGQVAAAVNQMCQQLSAQKHALQDETSRRIEAMEQLRHSDRLKTVGQLAAGLAHEVGTPLSVVSGRASMILASETLPASKIKRYAQVIKDESDRISQTVRKLLDFARQSHLHQTTGDLREVIRQSVALLRPLADKQGVQLKMEMPEAPASCLFDFGQMQQVLINLIDNAIDASSRGQVVAISLDSRESTEPTAWKIRVSDQGGGIPRENLPNVFEPFFTTKEVGAGTGLGLSIAHGIVEEHGGNITVHSELGQGTRFEIELPFARNPGASPDD